MNFEGAASAPTRGQAGPEAASRPQVRWDFVGLFRQGAQRVQRPLRVTAARGILIFDFSCRRPRIPGTRAAGAGADRSRGFGQAEPRRLRLGGLLRRRRGRDSGRWLRGRRTGRGFRGCGRGRWLGLGLGRTGAARRGCGRSPAAAERERRQGQNRQRCEHYVPHGFPLSLNWSYILRWYPDAPQSGTRPETIVADPQEP